jgi:DNA-binding PadR family transcriptional regulator
MPRRSAFSLAAALAIGLLLAACSGSGGTLTDPEGRPIPSDDAARDALNESLRSFNEACLAPQAMEQNDEFPITLIEPDTTRPTVAVRQLFSLESAGLLTHERTVDDRGLVRTTFRLTERGEEARETVYQFRGWRSAICYARPRVTRIDTVIAIKDRTPRPLAEVTFAFRYGEAAPWTRQREVQRQFPETRRFTQGTRSTETDRQTLVQTDDGWRALRVIRRTRQQEPTPGSNPNTTPPPNGSRNMW